jgi:hypothetical protein
VLRQFTILCNEDRGDKNHTRNFGGEAFWKTKEVEGLRWFLGKYVMRTGGECEISSSHGGEYEVQN